VVQLCIRTNYLSRLQKVEARNLIKPAYTCAVHQFKQNGLRGDNGRSPAVIRPYYQSAAFVGAAEDHQCRPLDGMFLCKRLDVLMDDIAIFQADYKDTSWFSCSDDDQMPADIGWFLF
jgi:hypothetical protein